ncbi:MAG: antibiotic biosynthesis monooxygenase [Tannerellaceae bacterium]|nr:antibiotic biosynthesis monooxygenase [Tannerellaceae bacterium]MCC8197192.1 antibiotic biosynthesis monooxygenase [Tannerellaceae bacterium]MCD7914202.1 antibiotic biosynthesis monooxygenase [Tannerellaceae bacterium]
MITIVAKAIVKEGKREEFIQTVQPMIQGSQAEEGNISYNLFEDLDNKNVLSFIEQWKDLAAIDFHNNTPHFLAGVAGIENLVESLEITKYQII